MHYNRSSNSSAGNKYIKKRGTSKLEGYHPKLHAVFSGNNYSGELAFVLVMLFNFGWNVARAIENCGEHDFGSIQLWRIEDINKRAEKLGLALPHYDISKDILPCTQERFCTQYDPTDAVLQAAKKEAASNAAAGSEGSAGVCGM